MTMRFRIALACLLVQGLGLTAGAQEQGGAIQGVVKDAQGGVLPGVLVEAKSAQTVGASRSVTDSLGVYRFPALPPGSYEVSATLTGFSPAKANAVVTLGQQLKVDLTMRVGGMSETVQVVGESPLIDLKANAATATVSKEVIDKIPKGRGYLSVLTQIPGTNSEARGGGLMIDGASGSENRFLVDGVDRTNARTGTALATTGTEVVIQDFVETVQVKQSGYNAEFRAALGGVVSAVTKSGSNTFHGSVGTYYTSNSYLGGIRRELRSVPTDLSRAEYLQRPRDEGHSIDPVFSLGGPILRDKVWFFAGYSPQQSRAERTVTWANPLTFERTQTFDDGSPYDRTFNYNLSSQITSKLRARFTGSNERAKAALGLPAIEQNGTSTANAASFNPRPTVRTALFQNSYSGVLDWVASNKLYVNMTGAYFGYGSGSVDGDYHHGTRRTFTTTNVGLLDVPASLQRVSGFADNPVNSFTVQDDYSRLNFSTDATWFSRWKGDHAVKLGVMYERIGNLANLGQQHANISFNWGGTYSTLSNTSARGRYGYFTAFRQFTGGDIKETNLSFFVQDQWTVNNKLTVNYGVRLENEEIPSYKPENPGVSFGWGDKIGPRLGFAYDLKGDGRFKAYGSWGVFYDTMKLEMPRGAWGGDHWIDYVYTLDTADWQSIDCPEINGGTRCTGGTFIEQNDRRHPSNEIANSLVDPNLKPTKKQEFTLGLDHELSKTMSVGVRYAHKWWNQTIDDVGVLVPGVGEVFNIANPGYGIGRSPLGAQFPPVPKVMNKYDGLEFVVRKRYTNNWQATGSLLFSRLFGNYGGLASSDENGRNSPNVSRYYDGLYMTYDQKGNETNGLLGTDRPVQFKLQGSYDLPWGTTIGANFFVMSGLLQSSTVSYATVPVFFNGRNDLGRTPTLSQLDAVLLHDFKLGGSRRLRLEANISNVLDQDTHTRVATGAYRDALVIPGFPNNPGAAFFQPAGFDTVAIQAARLPASGRPDPRYRQPDQFQDARRFRLLARVSF